MNKARRPLVSPGADLTSAETTRYARQISLLQIGVEGQRRLKAARVLVLGAGGLGSPVLTSLAAAGVGTIGVVDSDTVEDSNLQRQTIFRTADVGLPKAVAAVAALTAQNPLITITPLSLRMTAENVLALVADYDVVIDGTDNFETRYLAHDAAALLGKPYVWGSVLRFDGQVTVFWAKPPATSGIETGVSLRDLFADDAEAAEGESCAIAGVLGSVCASIGAAMATEAVKLIVGFGEILLGRLLVHDGVDASWREIRFGPKSAAAPSRAEARSEKLSAAPRLAQSPSITPSEVQELLVERTAGEAHFVLVDIREPWEHDVAAIDGAVLLPMSHLSAESSLEVIPYDATVILHCHHDTRSASAQQYLAQHGWSDIRFMEGGIDSWSRTIDGDVPRY
jgi:molybdopterin/thiamine biosynthesis adenylyltransferase/rhodanese-related sulfurtransferase